ncbi:adenosylcobyric acid synthase [Carnobacteriaceae bacterium zg-C25]|nr:adenosylcobyric acid synthase [Carnobacteriaceae bacterium zg-C25]
MTKTIRICHLYGNLLNTYGDNGNLLMLQHCAKHQGYNVETTIVSLDEPFDPNQFDLVFCGGGQDYEQLIVSRDIQEKRDHLIQFIENNGVVVAICGGFQLLGHYYIGANGEKIQGIGALNHYTLSQDNNRYIGDIEILDEETGMTYVGYENHNGRTFLQDGMQPLGKVISGYGNNNEDKTEGARYKNVFCSYFHGPLLVRNRHLAEHIIDLVVSQKQ